MNKRVFIPIWKGAGYVMLVPESGLTIEKVREFLLNKLQDPRWLEQLIIPVGNTEHAEPDPNIGYTPPEEWK